MNMMIENSDIYTEVLMDIIHVLNDIVHVEEKSFEHNIRIRNILDDLDNFNLSLQLNGIDMIKYTMLLSMKNINVELIESPLLFANMEFSVEEDKQEYLSLIKQYGHLRGILIEEHEFDERIIEYIEPSSRLVNVRVSLSIKDFIYFILTCAKYDELMDILVLISDYDEIMESLVSVSILLNDIIIVDDLFIRTMLDPDNRSELMNHEDTEVYIISNEEYINHCLENGKADVKLSTIGTCSLVAYRELVKELPKQQMKLENFQDIVRENGINIILPKDYCSLDEYLLISIHDYTQAWYNLMKKLDPDECASEMMLCSLGCFVNVFKMNTMIENYFRLQYETGLSEVFDILSIIEHKILN